MNNISESELKQRLENLFIVLNKKREEANKILVEIENICRDIIYIQSELSNVTKTTDSGS